MLTLSLQAILTKLQSSATNTPLQLPARRHGILTTSPLSSPSYNLLRPIPS